MRVIRLIGILALMLVAIMFSPFLIGVTLDVDAQSVDDTATLETPPSPALQPPVLPTATPAWVRPDVGRRPFRNAARIDDQEVILVTGDRNSRVIYGLTNDDWLYRSNDNGRSWHLMTTRPERVRFVMSPADPAILYSGSGVGCGEDNPQSEPMLKSMDGGRHWVDLDGSDGMRPLLAHPTEPHTLYAAGCDRLYLTEDGGATWTAKPGAAESNPGHEGRVSLLAGATLAHAIGVEPPHWGYLYAGGDDVAFSGDQGESWSQLTPRISPVLVDLNALAPDPYSAGRLWLADDQGVWATEDFGATWAISTSGLDRMVGDVSVRAGGGLNDLLFHPGGGLYLATNGGLYTLAPGATKWTFVPVTGVGTRPVTGILMTESAPRTLWLNTARGAYRYHIR